MANGGVRAGTTDNLDAIWFQTNLDRSPLFIAPLVIGVHNHFRDGRIGIMEARTASARSRCLWTFFSITAASRYRNEPRTCSCKGPWKTLSMISSPLGPREKGSRLEAKQFLFVIAV